MRRDGLTRLPERFRGAQREPARHRLLQRLDGSRQIFFLRLTYQLVDVLGHHDIAEYKESILLAHLFEGFDD